MNAGERRKWEEEGLQIRDPQMWSRKRRQPGNPRLLSGVVFNWKSSASVDFVPNPSFIYEKAAPLPWVLETCGLGVPHVRGAALFLELTYMDTHPEPSIAQKCVCVSTHVHWSFHALFLPC